jgi:hypothetical protein
MWIIGLILTAIAVPAIFLLFGMWVESEEPKPPQPKPQAKAKVFTEGRMFRGQH